MTIQLPVLLWTVICFVMLMLILSRFREEEAEHADRLAKEAAARAGKEAAAVLASAAAEQERAVEACRLSLEEEKKTLEKAADDKADELARAFLAALMKS